MKSLAVALLLTTLGAVTLATPVIAKAESFVCAAVMPSCDADGNPLAPFNNFESPCFEVYAARCQVSKPVTASCPTTTSKETAFKKQIRDLKLKLKLATRKK